MVQLHQEPQKSSDWTKLFDPWRVWSCEDQTSRSRVLPLSLGLCFPALLPPTSQVSSSLVPP